MDIHKPRNSNQIPSSLKLSNGYILPEGKLTPNALFVGGIDMKVDENEMRDFFTRYGAVKEVKIITYRGGICKGYGFVYFNEDVNIQSIVEQQISFKGRKLKLGPAIMKERSPRSMPSRLVGPAPWMSPTQYIYCTCCSPVGGAWHNLHPYSVAAALTARGSGLIITAKNRVHSTALDSGPEDTGCQSELRGLWSPNHADCCSPERLSLLADTDYSGCIWSKCRQDDILMFQTTGNDPPPQTVFTLPSSVLSSLSFNIRPQELSTLTVLV
ncbi:hypothetical protein INR49_023648 [Caranx melampygus]|nr:hypothetical protein INR49_023648 [Caranx melampygus]